MNQRQINQHPEDANVSSSQLGQAGPWAAFRNKSLFRRLAAATAALGFSLALMFGGAAASQAASAPNGAPPVDAAVAANTANVAPRGAIVWSIYDGAEITTSRNCENRMYYLAGIYSWDPTAHFMCQKYIAGTGYTYWMVLIGYSQ